MDGHIDGADMHFDNAVNFMFTEIGQGDIISKKEGKAGVVVLKIQAFPHPFGKLVDKAENTLIPAGVLFIHEIGFKLQPQGLILPLADEHRALFSLLVLHGHGQAGIGLIKAVIQHIHNGAAVNGNEGFPRPDSGRIGGAVWVYLLDENCHGFAPFLLYQS